MRNFELSLNDEDLRGNISCFIEEIAECENVRYTPEQVLEMTNATLKAIDADALHDAVWDAIDEVCKKEIAWVRAIWQVRRRRNNGTMEIR